MKHEPFERLLPAPRPYRYADGALMKEKMPLATLGELRSDLFPATNHVTAPGMHGGRARAREWDKVIRLGNGASVEVSGPRRARHRRLLDFVFAYSPPVPLANGNVGFFFDRRRAAKKVFGDERQFSRLEALVEEMMRILIRYLGADGDPIEVDMQPLVTRYVRFAPGASREIDASLGAMGYSPEKLDGACYLEVNMRYLGRLLSEQSIRYHNALRALFAMDDPVAEQLARYALTHQYLRARPLGEILDVIGAPKGRARDRAVQKLRQGGSADSLAALGIEIRPHGPRGQLCVFFVSGLPTALLVKECGLWL